MSRPRSTSVRKSLRLGGFLGAVGLTAVLAGVAVSGTGAYFSDTTDGRLSGTTGHIELGVTSDPTLVLDGLMPGVDQTLPIDYNVDVTGKADIWLTFEGSSANYLAFTGAKGVEPVPGGGLGRLGHFAVSTPESGLLFRSFNLANVPAGASGGCAVGADGRGGSDEKAATNADFPDYCGVPTAIKIASGVTDGEYRKINITFGLTGLVNDFEDIKWADVPFNIVATQEGIRPDGK